MDKPKAVHGTNKAASGENLAVHPDAPAGGGGAGHFQVAKSPVPMGFQDGKRGGCYMGPSASHADPGFCQDVQPGTRETIEDKESGVRIIVERQKDGLYHWLVETLDGAQGCEGVHDPVTEFTGEACEDITSKDVRDELEKQVAITEGQAPGKPPGHPVRREIILIKKDDWLTKISRDRWRTFEWERHLKPTQETLGKRRARRELFNPDLIYPGDTFEVIG